MGNVNCNCNNEEQNLDLDSGLAANKIVKDGKTKPMAAANEEICQIPSARK